MKATDLLQAQHDEVKSLFKRIEKSRKDDEKRALFEELAARLVGHDGIEREIFYPACKEAMGATELLGEAVVEHGVVEFSLYLADEAQGKEDFGDKLTVLSEIVSHHVREEENELFPAVEKAMAAELLEDLGKKMEARFASTRNDDFRVPLRRNLSMVLGGAKERSGTRHVKRAPAKQPSAKNGSAKKTTAPGRMSP